MDNRVYYGEYSLSHWIELILKQNIILPDYQRYFVWSENKTKMLIGALKAKRFVPPITIGAFKNADTHQNLILDGQQRLTSILLAYLGLFPDKATYKKAVEKFADENDDLVEDEEQFDNVYEWTFHLLTEKGKTKDAILSRIVDSNYKMINLGVDENFFKKTFLGFSYLVPNTDDEKTQQRYYSSVFRNINVQGEALLPQESRESLYYLDKALAKFFKPDFMNAFEISNSGNGFKLDFVKYLSLLSQFEKDHSEDKVARGYKPIMEKYYEEYIYSVVGESASDLFQDFILLFPNNDYASKFGILKRNIEALQTPKKFNSIIDADVYLFGLIYSSIFKCKSISTEKITELNDRLQEMTTHFKRDSAHTKAPASLKYLRSRIAYSIAIYKRHEDA